MIEYFLSDGGRSGNLWKREGSTDYLFSLKSLEWIKCKWVMILPGFNEITEQDALKFIEREKIKGPYEEGQLPVRYFLSDIDIVYATDVVGNEFYVMPDKSLEPAPYGTIDCMWGGISETDIECYL